MIGSVGSVRVGSHAEAQVQPSALLRMTLASGRSAEVVVENAPAADDAELRLIRTARIKRGRV